MNRLKSASESSSNSESNSPLYKKLKGNRKAMTGRGKRSLERKGSMENLSSGAAKDILDALDALRADFSDQFKKVNDKLEKLEGISGRVEVIEENLNYWEKRCKQSEIDEKKKWVVIKGLWKQEGATRFESRKQLSESLDELKVLMGVEAKFMDFYRLKDFKRNNDTMPGLVKVKFITSDDRDFFFSRVPIVGQKDDLKGISFQQDIPHFLVDLYKKLDAKAFQLRRDKKVKTRVVTRNLTLVLQTREKEEGSRWVNQEESQRAGHRERREHRQQAEDWAEV